MSSSISKLQLLGQAFTSKKNIKADQLSIDPEKGLLNIDSVFEPDLDTVEIICNVNEPALYLEACGISVLSPDSNKYETVDPIVSETYRRQFNADQEAQHDAGASVAIAAGGSSYKSTPLPLNTIDNYAGLLTNTPTQGLLKSINLSFSLESKRIKVVGSGLA
jgi:hypothetical protein